MRNITLNSKNKLSASYLILLFFMTFISEQQLHAQGINSGVTFNWADVQTSTSDPATIFSILINGLDYNTFVVPSDYELTRLGPGGHVQNNIWLNGSLFVAGSNDANWNSHATDAYQSINLNHYFQSGGNGDNICENPSAIATTNAQIQTIRYNPGIPSNPDGVLAVTERGGNNCLYVELYGIPSSGGPEQLLGSTFIRNENNLNGINPQAPPSANSDYWSSGRNNENNQVIGIALFELSNLAPIGSTITSIQYLGATTDHGDGKFFLMQTYAVDDILDTSYETEFNGDVSLNDNVPLNSIYNTSTLPSNGTAIVNPDGTFSYTPNTGFVGVDTFSVEVCLPAPNQAVCNISTVTITTNPPSSELSINDSSATEGDDLIFTITNSQPVNRPIVVDLSYINITTTNSDYSGFLSITLPANQPSVSFNIAAIDDTLIEAVNETFNITISSTDIITISDNEALGTIIDNDASSTGTGITFTNTNVIVDEGTDLFAVYNVTLTGAISENVTVDYTTNEGTALNPVDFTTTTGILTFTPAVNSVDIQVPITDDSIIEPQENFSVTLSNIQSNIGIGFVDGNTTNTANGTINDDDMGDIVVEPYQEEMTIVCGEEIPEVPTLIFSGGCGNYVVDYSEAEQAATGSDDFVIIRTWNVTDSCGNTATFEQLIFVMQAEKEFITIDICVEDPAIDLLDYLPAGFDTTGEFTVETGVVLNGSMFEPDNRKVGEYLISYAAEDTSCKFYADFTINVNADCLPCDIKDLVVSKTITVNGDGINDYFEITGLESCGFTYNVMVFNRWGTKVYEAVDYQNDWGGYAPNGSLGSAGILPTGTYYYMISLPDTDIAAVNGYIYLGSN